MPTITDVEGAREISDAEVGRRHAEADARFEAFWEALQWRAIGEYDRDRGDLALLRSGSDWAIGYWGTGNALPEDEQTASSALPTWRDAGLDGRRAADV